MIRLLISARLRASAWRNSLILSFDLSRLSRTRCRSSCALASVALLLIASKDSTSANSLGVSSSALY